MWLVCDLLVVVLKMLIYIVIDIGCGLGNLMEVLIVCVLDVMIYGIDVLVDMIVVVCKCLLVLCFDFVDVVVWDDLGGYDLILLNVVL